MAAPDDLVSLSPPDPLRLSKSRFLAGVQCLKRLHLAVHHPEWATPRDAAIQAMLDMGSEIGMLARRRFPGGVLVRSGYRDRHAALAETKSLLEDPTVPAIFEGAFLYDGVLVRVDVLERVPSPDGDPPAWRLIEVKSSARMKEIHLDDLAIQSHVLLSLGLPVIATCLMHINTDYVFAGSEVDLQTLFTIENTSEFVAARRLRVPERLAAMKAVLLDDRIPSVEPGRHCHSPHQCPFWEHCTKDKSGRWIFHLPGSKDTMTALVEQGVLTIDDIPEGTALSQIQRRVKQNVEWISDELACALRAIEYPVHHLDFETVMLAVPRFPGTRPYQAIPVQWSNHIEDASGRLLHQEFLHGDDSEPRRRWAESLIESLGRQGSICVYSSYERAIMEQLVDAFPEYRAAFEQILKRLWDLLPVIRDHYYHPAFRGSYSIKSVLPAVTPLTYEDLDIQEGGQAASEYYRMVFIETDWIERAAIRDALLQYCARDTMAMVQVRRVLQEKVRLSFL